MVGAGHLADQGRKAGPLLTVICAAVFLASGLAAVFEALTLSQGADTLARAPVCGPSRVPADCRLHLGGTVVGGYDEGSGLTPERHIDVKASNGDVLHLDSPIVGAPPQIGSSVELEYWKGKLVRFATTAGIVSTGDHPGQLSRTSRLLAWFAFGLAGLSGVWFMSAFRRGRLVPHVSTASDLNIGVSRWFFIGVAVVIGFVGFVGVAADGFNDQTLVTGLKRAGLMTIGLSLVILSAIGRKVTLTHDGLLYVRRFVTFPSITKVTLEAARLPFSSLRIVTIHARNARKPISVDTKYFGWDNRVRLLQTIGSRSPQAQFDANAGALREGEPVGRPMRAPGTDPWQSQNRGCATALLGVGSGLIVLGLLFETLGGPPIAGLWVYAIGAIFVGVGIHRNIRVLRAYFGSPRGDFLFLLQTLAPLIAWGIDAMGETSSNSSMRLLFRFLSLLPFLAVWMLIWLPLSKAQESIADQTRSA
jgi:hypothetical protein